MTKTVLQMVQIILNDMDSEPVNQLSDTLEAEQVASVLAETFNDIVTTREIPEHLTVNTRLSSYTRITLLVSPTYGTTLS